MQATLYENFSVVESVNELIGIENGKVKTPLKYTRIRQVLTSRKIVIYSVVLVLLCYRKKHQISL